MKKHTWMLGLIFVTALGVGVGAEQRGTATRVEPPPQGISKGVKFDAPWRPNNKGGSTRVIGSVVDIRQLPIAHVSVRLRNVITGEIVAVAESDENGEYSFGDLDPATYVVEMFTGDRYVVMVSNVGSISTNETLQTVITLPGRWNAETQSVAPVQSLTSFGGVSAATTMTAVTLTVAQDQNIPPANPGIPVSPR